MNAISAMCYEFLLGKRLSIKTAARDFGITNLPREASRSFERKFGVRLERVHKTGKTKYGTPCTWFEYWLNDTKDNRTGRLRAKEYVKKQIGQPKTEKELQIIKTLTLL